MSKENNHKPKAKLPDAPYKGLDPYSESDAPFFFGREREWKTIADNLIATRLTLLYGDSGVGKSSLLRAGVAYHLMQDSKKNIAEYGAPELAVVVFNSWQDDPLESLVKQVEKDIKSLLHGKTFEPLSSSQRGLSFNNIPIIWILLREINCMAGIIFLRKSVKLDKILEILAKRLDETEGGGSLFIILDQFEEYFLYHPDEKGTGTFAAEFPRTVNRLDLSVNFLISIREDSLAKLDQFKISIPNLFNNYLRVKHLDAKSAHEAIVKPIEKYNSYCKPVVTFALCLLTQNGLHRLASLLASLLLHKIEKDLAKEIIDQVSQVVRESNGVGGLEKLRPQLKKQIETPYLQLVMTRLWEEEMGSGEQVMIFALSLLIQSGLYRLGSLLLQNYQEMNVGSRCLQLKTFINLGGAEQIVRDHLNEKMESLNEDERKAAANVFQYLVTPSGNKIAYPVLDLVELTGLRETQLKNLLEKLSSGSQRILRPVGPSPSKPNVERYEIFHDILAQPILDWRKQYLLDEEKQRRNLAIKEGLPAQSLRQLKLGYDEKAALLARQAYRFYQREPNKVLYQIDDALREALCIPNFSNLLQGHKKGLYGLTAVAFNPQNPYVLASADDNGIVRFWDLRRSPDARQPRTLKHQNGGVNALAFSPDGKMLASGRKDGTVELWNLDELYLPGQIVGRHKQSVTSVAFNYDGTIIASGSKDGNIQLWDSNNQSENKPLTEQPLRGPETVVRAVAFSPNEETGYLLASGSKDERVRLWDIRQPDHSLKVLNGHRGVVRSVAFSPDGQILASGSDDKTVRLWDVRDLEHRDVKPEILEGHKNHVWSVAFSPNGQMLASGSEDQTVYLWKVNALDKKPTILDLGHDFGISTVAFSPDNQILASGSWDKTIRLWNLHPSEVEPQILGRHDDNVMSVAVSRDGRWLASGSGDKTVKLWDLHQPNSEPRILGTHKDQVFAVAFSLDGTMLASGSADMTIKLWMDFQKGETISQELKGHQNGVSSLAFSQDSKWLVSGGWRQGADKRRGAQDDRTVRLWDLRDLRSMPTKVDNIILWHHDESVTSVAFSPDSQQLASCSDDQTIKLVNWGEIENLLSQGNLSERPRPNSLENDIMNRITILRGHTARILSVAFSTNSTMLASGSDDRTIRLWDLSQIEKKPKVLEDHNFWVGSVAFSPDGIKLASGSYDKTIRVWDLNHLKEYPIVLRGHEQSVTSVAFYPDGKKLVSGSYDNTIREWIVDTQILADMVCDQVQRNLSQKEWDWFMEADIPYELTCPNLPPGEGISEVVRAEEVSESELERDFRDKLAQLFPGQKYLLKFIEQRAALHLDTAEEDITNSQNKPKGDEGTYYRLETLRLLGFLEITDKGHGCGTIRYSLSPRYREYLSQTRSIV